MKRKMLLTAVALCMILACGCAEKADGGTPDERSKEVEQTQEGEPEPAQEGEPEQTQEGEPGQTQEGEPEQTQEEKSDPAQESEIPDDYIAVFHGGSGELTHETYIYKIDNGQANMGFRYINAESWGMTAKDWQQRVVGTGEVTWTDEVFGVAEENDAYSFVTLPNDTNVYMISDFRSMFLMN